MPRLIVMRHADAAQSGPTDFERPLTDRGREQAEEAGRWLAEVVSPPALTVVSAAVRAQQTHEALLRGTADAGWSGEVRADRTLYSCGSDTVLDLLREVESADPLLLIGHNPTVASVAALLDDGSASADLESGLTLGGFSPATVAVFDVPGPWAEIDYGTARLVAVHEGR